MPQAIRIDQQTALGSKHFCRRAFPQAILPVIPKTNLFSLVLTYNWLLIHEAFRKNYIPWHLKLSASTEFYF